MSARWWSLMVWALAAAGALFWGLKVFVHAPAAPPHTRAADTGALARNDLTRLLGAEAPAVVLASAPEPTADARYQLIGVVSPRSKQAAREGVALIAVDGKPAKAFRVGAVVDGQTVLQAVGARGATLGPRDGAALVALNIAPPAAAATGTLPPPGPNGLPNAGGRPLVMPVAPVSRRGVPQPDPNADAPPPALVLPQDGGAPTR